MDKEKKMEELLRGAYSFIYHFVDLREAEINGFSVMEWLDEVDKVLPPETE